MMKLRLSLRNSVRIGLPLSLCILSSPLLYLISGCSSSTKPTYSKENIVDSIRDICKKEYSLDVKVKLVGRTLWIYLPLEDIIEKAEKPEKYIKRFSIEDNKVSLKEGIFNFEYLIKLVPEKEGYQEIKYSKSAAERLNNAWNALRRVLFSMEHSKEDGLRFICLATADIKNGFQIQDILFHTDLKKVFYGFISWSEYQHRTIQDMQMSPQIIGDKEGLHLNYRDITWEEFIVGQIQQRIKLKFEKPEVERNTDIDKEILKIAAYTLKIYGFRDFSGVDLNNLLTQRKLILNQAAVLAEAY